MNRTATTLLYVGIFAFLLALGLGVCNGVDAACEARKAKAEKEARDAWREFSFEHPGRWKCIDWRADDVSVDRGLGRPVRVCAKRLFRWCEAVESPYWHWMCTPWSETSH